MGKRHLLLGLMDRSLHTVVSFMGDDRNGSIYKIDSRECLRLRLQQTLHLRYQSKVFVRLSVRMQSPPPDSQAPTRQECTVQVHYVELIRLGSETQKTGEGAGMFSWDCGTHKVCDCLLHAEVNY
jgi:hypothetical protein